MRRGVITFFLAVSTALSGCAFGPGDCVPGDRRCIKSTVQECDDDGVWRLAEDCRWRTPEDWTCLANATPAGPACARWIVR